uniref:Eukaryotic translation initiation factor 2 subunit 2 n=1 Tax=Acrobeloides nanus TaxID=290746 RepID=A0A914E0A7_9BILA
MSDEEVLDLTGLRKPRKKPKVLVEVEDDYEFTDYTYDELLGFIFEKVREQNPEFAYGGRKKLVMKPPQTIISRKKSIFTNFFEICRLLKRDPKHLMQFLLSELGSKGSIDGNQWLIVEGRFQQKDFESLLRKYISK